MKTVFMSPVWCQPLLRVLLSATVLLTTGVATADDSPLRPAAETVLLPVSDARGTPVTLIPTVTEASDAPESLILVGASVDATTGKPLPAKSQPHVTQVEKGSSSRKLRKSAIEVLPLGRLRPQYHQAASAVLDDLSLFRRLPAYQCELDPRVHDYFTKHPDVAVSIWRAMAISNLQMTQRNSFQYDIDTRDGTTGKVTVLHHTRESCLVLCDGMFRSPYLKKPIRAKSLMHLRTNITHSRDGRTFVTHQADLFVSFPSQGIGTLARLISPVSNTIIDRNFQEISLFIHVMWLAMKQQPGWIDQIANRLDGVHPSRKDELIKLTADIYVTSQINANRRSGQPVSLKVIRPPGQSPTASTPPPGTVP